jgi:mono/diheme cytochrome c family protein
MVDRPERRPLGGSRFFDDRTASRPLVADVVPREAAQSAASLQRGREQYQVFCTPCHGARGDGNGLIVQHGFPRPPDLRTATAQDVINAITLGKGNMYSYADRIQESDRLAIAAYIQTLERRR